MQSKSTQEWDYTNQAKYYSYRPNYSKKAIDKLINYVRAKKNNKNYQIADVGAGTANLTILLLERGLNCIAIEPNKSMMEVGIERTKNMKCEWINATAENTTLDNFSIDWYVMGSSFNTTDRLLALKEANRVLKPKGFFSCMWNNRELENDPDQKRIEEIIKSEVPEYEHGVRREGQADFILASKLFNNIYYIEDTEIIKRSLEEYINAWKSVKNKYWDFNTEKGRQRFNNIINNIVKEFGEDYKFKLSYTTKIWTANKI